MENVVPEYPYTSMGSRRARPISSKPRFKNFAIFASVPASTTRLVMTLCACRLYRGMIMRRPDPDDVVEAKDETELEYE